MPGVNKDFWLGRRLENTFKGKRPFREVKIKVGRLCERRHKCNGGGNSTEGNCVGRRQMAGFVFNGIVLTAKIKIKKGEKK